MKEYAEDMPDKQLVGLLPKVLERNSFFRIIKSASLSGSTCDSAFVDRPNYRLAQD